MCNAKEELKEVLAADGMAGILAAEVSFNQDFSYLDIDENGCVVPSADCPASEVFTLRTDFTDADLQSFWNFIDQVYDDGYGSQEFFGTIWLKDGSWLSRGEYDGREWWRHNKRPLIPRKAS